MTRKDAPEVDEQMSLYRLLQRRKVRSECPAAAAAWWACYDLLYIRTYSAMIYSTADACKTGRMTGIFMICLVWCVFVICRRFLSQQ